MTLDPRLNAFRPDLAAENLRGKVDAARFSAGEPARIRAPSAAIRKQPRPDVPYLTEALMGELVTIYDRDEEGWAWVQLARDGYVGWLAVDALGPVDPAPTHRVVAPRAFVYPVAGFKAQPLASLSLGAAVQVTRLDGKYAATPHGFIHAGRLAPILATGGDYVTIAESLAGTAYLWGGKSGFGIDCSGLVQLALEQVGIEAPRDSDMLERAMGRPIARVSEPLQRGDLVFWKGHVGIMRDADTLLHANVHAMAVASEPLAEAIERIARQGDGEPTSIRRL